MTRTNPSFPDVAPQTAVPRERATTNYGKTSNSPKPNPEMARAARHAGEIDPGAGRITSRFASRPPQRERTVGPQPAGNGKSLTLRAESNPQER